MFSFFRLFCNTKEIHKLLIKEDLYEYNSLKDSFNNKFPLYIGYYTIKDYEKLDESTKKIWSEFKTKNFELRERLINDLLTYSKNYPNEKISRHRYIIEYKEYPYRLQENLNDVLSEL